MKLTIDSPSLKRALSRAAGVIATRTTIPILEAVMLKADNDALTVEATDMEIMVIERVPCTVATPGAVAVGGKALAEIVNSLPAAPIEMELAENGRLRMKSGVYKAALPTLDAKDYPVLRSGELPCRFSLPAALLRSVIKKIGFAQGTDTTRTYLNGIYMHVTADPEKALCFAATDGMVMAISRQEMPAGAANLPGLIIPLSSIAQIAKIAGDVEGDIQIGASDTRLELQAGALTFSTKLIAGSFPDYQRLIPRSHKSRLRLIRGPLAEGLGVVAALQGKAVKFAISADGVILSGTESEQSQAEATLAAGQMELEGDPLDIGVWMRNMRNIVGATEGDIEMLMTDPLGPLVLAHCDDPTVQYVTMPYRV